MTLAVIRVLSPDDYGLMALVMVCTNVLAGFSSLGLGDALVQQEHTPKPLVASVFGPMLLISAALTMLTFLAAYPITAWYREPHLVLAAPLCRGRGWPAAAIEGALRCARRIRQQINRARGAHHHGEEITTSCSYRRQCRPPNYPSRGYFLNRSTARGSRTIMARK